MLCALLLLVSLGAAGAAVERPGTALAAECNGDECQAPPPAPDDPTPGTATAEGPPNPPARFPEHHKKHHHHGGARQRGEG